MTLTVPLAVRLKTNRSDRHITRDLRDLSFREVKDGGYASATLSLHRPLSLAPDEIAHYARVYVYDPLGVQWEGRLEDPGSSVGADGEVWHLTAIGPSAHASDRTQPRVYIDTTSGQWRTAVGSTKHIEVSVSGGEAGEITIRAPSGTLFSNGNAGIATYQALNEAGQKLRKVAATWDAPTTIGTVEVALYTSIGAGAPSQVDSAGVTAAGGTLSGIRGGVPTISADHDVVQLRYRKTTSNATADENYWAEFSSLIVAALLKNKSGADLTSGDNDDFVLASEVVEDMLGRDLDQYDGANAVVTATTHHIDQLAYPDGTTCARVLDDLLKVEPGFRWGAYESNAAGKHRVEWVALSASVRYEASVVDGWTSPASARDFYNKVRVRWVDASRRVRSTSRTLSVPVLTDAGLTREGFIDLGDDIGSAANAERVGDQFLAEHAAVQSGGRVTISQPVLDLATGRMVKPWQIKTGELIRLREIEPRTAAVNATARDGISTFRIMSKDFTASTASAELELDEFTRSVLRPQGFVTIDGGGSGRRRR